MRLLLTGLIGASVLVLVSLARAEQTPFKGVTLKQRIENRAVAPETVYRFNRLLSPGRTKQVQTGSEGTERLVFNQVWIDDHMVNEQLISTVTQGGQPKIIEMGSAGFNASRGSGAFRLEKSMEMESTAYAGSASGSRTRTGRVARFGVIAVDPKVIPLHTLVFVEGYGFAVAADTGGAIKGNIVDVCFASEAECVKWGRRKVKVHIFRERAPQNVDQAN